MGEMDDESLVGNEIIQPNKYQEMTELVHVDINDPSCADAVYNLVHNIFFRILTLVLIITDCALIVADVAIYSKAAHEQTIYDSLAVLFAILFCVEVSMRIYAVG